MSATAPNSEPFAEHVAKEIQHLRQFDTFARLPCWALIPLASAARFILFKPGEQICARGDEGHDEYFLIEGSILLTAADGRSQQIDGGSALAGKPLALLRPRKYELRAQNSCQVLILDQRYYRSYLKEMTPLESDHMLQEDSDLYSQFLQDLNLRRINLPLPQQQSEAMRQALKTMPLSRANLSALLMQAPTITTNLLRLANSPLFSGQGPCQEILALIRRLGTHNSAALIRAFSQDGLAHDEQSPALLELTARLHRDAREMAALCCVIAHHCPGFNRETAALVGLLHNIGLMLVESYLQRTPQYADMFGNLEKISRELGSRIGHELLSQWHFPEPLCDAQSNLCNWYYHKREEIDYTSLMICAQVHHHLMHPESYQLPPIHEIPALTELPCGTITPQESIRIIQQARTQLQHFAPQPATADEALLMS